MLRKGYLNHIRTSLTASDIPIEEIELEAKFGYYKRKRDREGYDFVSDVGWRKFKALKQQLLDRDFVPIHQHITDFIYKGGIRKQVIIVEDQGQVEKWQRKTKWRHFSDGPTFNYGVRVTISQETDDITREEIAGLKRDIVRTKDRTSYYYNDFLRIDMTEVSTDENENITYEVEVEILKLYEGSLEEKFQEFDKLLYHLFQFIHDTLMLYTKFEREELARFINTVLGEREGVFLNYGMVANARNLKIKDMVWGGLIGNELGGELNPYSVTHKADGLRKFLVINKTGIWFVYPRLEFNLVYRFTSKRNAGWLNGLILDGELIPKDDAHRRVRDVMGRLEAFEPVPGIEEYSRVDRRKLKFVPDAEYWFLVFDTLALSSNKDIQRQPHSERLKAAYQRINEIHDIADNRRLVISFKSFRQISSPEQFFPLMQQMFAEKNLLPYEDDGFIFTPEMAPYNPIRYSRLSLRDRSLVVQSDICKWKPVEKLTIDFAIRHRRDGKIDLLSKGFGRKMIVFDGTTYNPFDVNTMVSHDHPLIAEHPTGAILEFAWDMENRIFIPLKARPDKKDPNHIEVAEDNWNMIHNPVTEETLKGENFTLMKKYHNRLKRDLFRLSRHNEKFLLDIGSGKGGDVDKWKRFDKIVAVEPSAENIEELERRIHLHKMENKVKVVQAGGEDTEIIKEAVQDFMGRKVDVISLMMSMTFFWKTSNMLEKLITTVDENLAKHGSIIFITMDGDTVEEVFEPYFPSYRYNKLIFNQTKEDEGYAVVKLQPRDEVKKDKGRQVWIYIQDSIVGKKAKAIEPQFRNLPIIRPPLSELVPIPIEYTKLPIIFSPKRVPPTKSPTSSSSSSSSSESKIVFQQEYLVHLMDFERLLSKRRKIVSKNVYRADRQMFLTGSEKGFSLMYSWGIYEISEGRSFLEDEYRQYKLLKDIRSSIIDNYEDSDVILEQLSYFLYAVSETYGNPITPLSLSDPLTQDFLARLMDNGIKEQVAMEIVQHIQKKMSHFLSHPSSATFLQEEDIARQGNVFTIGEANFYIDPDRMSVIDSMLSEDTHQEKISKILAMLLRHYSIFHNLRPLHLPKDFYHLLAKKYKKNLILDAYATPLTAQMQILGEGEAQQYFASVSPGVDNPFGSVGFIQDLYLPDFPEIYTTIVSFPQLITNNMSALARKYQKWLEVNPENKFLRIIFFVPKIYEDEEFYIQSQRSKFLVFETEIMFDQPFHVFIFESPRTRGERYEDLFDIDFQSQQPQEELPRYVRDIIQDMKSEAILYTQKEIYLSNE